VIVHMPLLAWHGGNTSTFHRDVIYVKGTKSDEDREVPIKWEGKKLFTELVSVAKQNDHNYQFTNTKTKRHHAHQKRVEHGPSKSGNCEPAFPRSTPHVRNASGGQRRFDRGGLEGHGSQVD
jgi:hypothetical protein